MKTFLVKICFICRIIRSLFQINSFALTFDLKQKLWVTWKLLIEQVPWCLKANVQSMFRGECRGRVQGMRTLPPDMTCGFLILLVFCQKAKNKKTKNYVVYWCWSRARDDCTPSWKKSRIRPWCFIFFKGSSKGFLRVNTSQVWAQITLQLY